MKNALVNIFATSILLLFSSSCTAKAAAVDNESILYHPLIFQIVDHDTNVTDVPDAILQRVQDTVSVFFMLYSFVIALIVFCIVHEVYTGKRFRNKIKEKKLTQHFSIKTPKPVIIFALT